MVFPVSSLLPLYCKHLPRHANVRFSPLLLLCKKPQDRRCPQVNLKNTWISSPIVSSFVSTKVIMALFSALWFYASTCLAILLYFTDILSDVVLSFEYFLNGDYYWGAFTIGLVIQPWVRSLRPLCIIPLSYGTSEHDSRWRVIFLSTTLLHHRYQKKVAR